MLIKVNQQCFPSDDLFFLKPADKIFIAGVDCKDCPCYHGRRGKYIDCSADLDID